MYYDWATYRLSFSNRILTSSLDFNEITLELEKSLMVSKTYSFRLM